MRRLLLNATSLRKRVEYRTSDLLGHSTISRLSRLPAKSNAGRRTKEAFATLSSSCWAGSRRLLEWPHRLPPCYLSMSFGWNASSFRSKRRVAGAVYIVSLLFTDKFIFPDFALHKCYVSEYVVRMPRIGIQSSRLSSSRIFLTCENGSIQCGSKRRLLKCSTRATFQSAELSCGVSERDK